MCAMQMIAHEQLDRVLRDCVAEDRPAVITHHGPRGWRAWKANFIATPDRTPHIWLRLRAHREEDEPIAMQPGDAVGITFRVGHKKCMFSSLIASAAKLSTDGVVTIGRPDRLQQLQRRVFERAKPPAQAVIPVRIWRETGEVVPVESRAIRHGQLEDISVGGMRVKVACAQDFEIGAVYRCAFSPRPAKPSVIVDALVRHHEAAHQGRASIGFQFLGLETSADGQRMMERLAQTVTHFQRARSHGRRRTPQERPPHED
jgi:c-di-GMP-binding flagellar brake protein YcgR